MKALLSAYEGVIVRTGFKIHITLRCQAFVLNSVPVLFTRQTPISDPNTHPEQLLSFFKISAIESKPEQKVQHKQHTYSQTHSRECTATERLLSPNI